MLMPDSSPEPLKPEETKRRLQIVREEGPDKTPLSETRFPALNQQLETPIELSGLTLPGRPRPTYRSIAHSAFEDLREAGITKRHLFRESAIGAVSAALRWGANYSLVSLGIQAAADRSPSALIYVGIWAIGESLSAWGDRLWRIKVDEHGRAYERKLYSKLLHTFGRSSIKDLDDTERQAQLELHHERADSISQMIEHLVELPGHLTKFGLSAAVLFTADWRIGLLLVAAVAPGTFLKSRHTREDMDLDERQAKSRKIVDTISDEAYSGGGSVRMILGGMTRRVQASIERIQLSLDTEKNLHERRQALKQGLTDVLYFGVLTGSLGMLFGQYQAGAIGIGALSFLFLQLTELGTELDQHGDTAQEYLEIGEKLKRFYGFVGHRVEEGQNSFPANHSLKAKGAIFIRGQEPDCFTVTLPDFSLAPGDFMVIHGANGAGKTTTVRHLAFGSRPDRGEFIVGDIPSHEIKFNDWIQSISYCGATPALLMGQTIREALTLDHTGESYLKERINHPLIADLMQDLSTRNGLETRIGLGLELGREFSTGELQRLALVTALIPPRKILFLDEVTANQSDAFISIVLEEIAKLREAGTIVVFATHSKRFDGAASHMMQVSRGEAEMV